MRKTLITALSFCTLFSAGCAPHRPPDRVLREITLSGSGYERGLQHGRQLRAKIGEIVRLWKENVKRTTGQHPDEVLQAFFAYAGFTDAIQKWTPELYDEVRGIAEGSGQRFEEVYVLNLLDEFWVYLDDPDNHHCSGLGVPASDGRPAYVAQNMDLETYTDGFQVLFRIRSDGQAPEQLILSHAGLIGLNGMNEAGVGVCVNTLMQLKASSTGVPVAFVVRGLIARKDREEVLDFIQKVPHASGQNYIIGMGAEVVDFEASAGKVVQFRPEGVAGAVFHTNHPLVNDDLKPWHADQEFLYPANSVARLEAVRSRLASGELPAGTSPPEILRSKDDAHHPVCRANRGRSGVFTFASVIMTLGDQPFLRVTAGPPDESEYEEFHFTRRGD